MGARGHGGTGAWVGGCMAALVPRLSSYKGDDVLVNLAVVVRGQPSAMHASCTWLALHIKQKKNKNEKQAKQSISQC